MKLTVLKSFIGLAFMTFFLLFAFLTQDDAKSQLFATLSIITGAFTFKHLSTQKINTDEKHGNINTH